ncbi:hypothetical protein ELS17_04935 [Natrinema altunense]|uniref:Uncharacterized protein n=1 Tax=Natrinema altunense TaxID=222984 RepID=A0A482Y2I5_9EURY|nr:hypothetical protein [Natrinema altunense]RZH69682.1 hypothetical protein ELS17_04935 [Natrinema altunense]
MGYAIHDSDLVLICLAVSLENGAVVGYATPVLFPAAAVVLGPVSIALIGHALFVNGRVDDTADLSGEIVLQKMPAVPSPMESGPEPEAPVVRPRCRPPGVR